MIDLTRSTFDLFLLDTYFPSPYVFMFMCQYNFDITMTCHSGRCDSYDLSVLFSCISSFVDMSEILDITTASNFIGKSLAQ